MREWLARLRDWIRRDELDGELAEELRFHQGYLERDALAEGRPTPDAARIARRRLGNVTRWREEARARWSLPMIDHVMQDLRYARRGLRRTPGYTATVVLTLALGLGANAAMFGVIDRLMFRPFPFLRDPSSVHRVYLQTSRDGRPDTRSSFAYATYLDLRRWTTSFSDYAGFSEWTLAVGAGGASRERQVAGVSASFFGFFDAQPALGRFFGPSEDSLPRGDNVSVLGHAFWRAEYGGRNVVGQSLQVGPLLTTIVGVAPRGFVGVSEGEPPAVFIPITTLAFGVNQGTAATFASTYGWTWMSTMLRRKPGRSVAAATTDLTNAYVLSRRAQKVLNPRVLPDSIAHPVAIAGSLKAAAGPDAGLEAKTLLWVTGVAVIVLCIACANVANLMLARTMSRRREIAVRLALGVSRQRLIAQFLTESLILAALGGVAGLALGEWVSAGLLRVLVHDQAPTSPLADHRTIAVACLLAVAAAVATSAGPALLAVRGDLTLMLRTGARAGTYQRSRTRAALLVLQGALSVILLVGAGLFVRSLVNARSLPLGWDPDPVLIVTPNYRGVQLDSATRDAFRRRLLETAQSLDGVRAAARVNSLPFGTNTNELFVEGIDSVARLGRFNYQSASADYFAAVGTRIVRGRGFTQEDRDGATPVTVVSAAMGRVLWPNEDPVGKCIRINDPSSPCRVVVGVAEDAVQQAIGDEERLMYYLSDEQAPNRPGNRIFVRMSGRDAQSHAERIRQALQRMMPGEAYVTVAPLAALVDRQRHSWELGATMFCAFGALALIVAAVGLHGVIAFNVAERTHELGVRIALGAQPMNIILLVVRQGMSLAATGVAIGLLVSLAAAPWVQPLLFRESARDPLVYLAVSTVIAVVALVASLVPAVRATRANPNAALRSD